MKYAGILFDFNGTLFFDSHYHDLAWKQVSKEIRGYPFTDEEIAQHMHGKNNEKIIDYIYGKPMEPSENKRYSLKKEAIYRQMCLAHPEEFHLAPGVEDFLDACKQQGIPMIIATASIIENVRFFVEHFHLERWMDPSLIVYDDGSFEDKVTMFQEAARRLHVNVNDCLVFEDSLSGIRFAHEAEVKDIIVINSVHDVKRYEQFPYITYICDDFVDFPMDLLQ